ncbi:MAG: hypothetical protein ACREBO_03355 [Novosphingobium sp.]
MITIAITGCVALFADGENREAIAAEVEARTDRNDLLTAEADKLGARKLKANGLKLREGERSYMAFAPDEPVSEANYGTPMDGSDVAMGGGQRGVAVSLNLPGEEPSETAMPSPPPGLPAGAKAAVRPKPVQLDEEQRAAIAAASRARSGGNSEDD